MLVGGKMERVVECIKTMLELIADVSVLQDKYTCVRCFIWGNECVHTRIKGGIFCIFLYQFN